MNAQKQRKNTAAAIVIIVLILLAVLGISLYFLFSKPSAPPAAPVTKTETVTPATTTVEQPKAPSGPQILGVHKVVPRDTLWWISDKWYKDPVLWPSIYEINKALIKDPDLIYPGQAFDIPALSGTAANLSAADKSLLAQGYLEAYRVYKEKGKKDAEAYRVVSEKLKK